MSALSFLLMAQGKTRALADRLTPARIAKLDYLDTTISSRAKASTALTSATWTTARANNLNSAMGSVASQTSVNALQSDVNAISSNTDAALSSRLASVFGSRKVQRGNTWGNASFPESLFITVNETMKYVDIGIQPVSAINKCLVFVDGGYQETYSSAYHPERRIIPFQAYLINTSTLRIVHFAYLADERIAGGPIWASWEVMEFV